MNAIPGLGGAILAQGIERCLHWSMLTDRADELSLSRARGEVDSVPPPAQEKYVLRNKATNP